jgi:hypothetical protein
MNTHGQTVQLATQFVVLLPFFVALSAPGILFATFLARRWRGAVKWKSSEYAFIVPLILVWYLLFYGAAGKTWANFALEPFLVGLTAIVYVCVRRYADSGCLGYVIAMTVCSLAVALITWCVPSIPCAE